MNTITDLLYTPVSYKGTKYSPLQHYQVDELILEQLDKKNLHVTNKIHHFKSNGEKLITKLDLGYLDDELNYSIAWRNSLDGSMSFQIANGTMVKICENMNIFGENKYKRRHIGNSTNEIINNVIDAIEGIDYVVEDHINFKQRLKEKEIYRKEMAHLIGDFYINESLITSNQLSILKKEIEAPTIDYKADNTYWDFYNKMTYSIKESHPLLFMNNHINVSNKFKELVYG